MPDYRLNSRSPYYIDGEVQITEVTPPPPVEENTPPTVTITASNDTPYVGETITLTAVATDSDGTVVSYSWNTSETTTSIDVVRNKELCHDFYVVVTDDDGDTATATKRICWQEVPDIITNPETTDVACGETFGEGSFTGEIVYRITDVGDKIGDIELFVIAPQAGSFDVPVNFTLEWNGLTASTGYVGSSDFDNQLLGSGVESGDIFTLSETTKSSPTSVSLTKSAATPTEVLIRATTPLINDQFQLITSCPDVIPAVTTKYYTLESTCDVGDTTFTYTDVDGATQTVNLGFGETQLVSAQEGSVSVPVCTGVVTEGGQSFDKGTPALTFDDKTDIVILFDDSGSMAETEQPLLDMANGILKETLLSYYQGNVAEYEKRVNVYKYKDFAQEFIQPVFPDKSVYYYERFLKLANYGKINADASRSIYLIFTDEVQYSGTSSEYYKYQTDFLDSSFAAINQSRSVYLSELADYRTFLNSVSYGEHLMRLFAVQKATRPDDPVTVFLQNIFSGEESFYGDRSLADRSEASIEEDVLRNGVSYSADKYYYYNYVVKALRDYGFNI